MPQAIEIADAKQEADLVAQIAGGDLEAFRLLYSRYKRPLFSLAIRMVGNAADAEELLQDSFLKIWRSAPSFDSQKSRPFTWAVTILRRTCIDHLRKRHSLLGAAGPLDDVAPADQPYSRDDCWQAAQYAEDSERIRGALDDIPAGQRQALELVLFSGMTHVEVAKHMKQPIGTIKSWIRRGLLGLRTNLKNPKP